MPIKTAFSLALVAVLVPMLFAGCGPASGSTSLPAAPPEPFTGQVHEVKMRGAGTRFYFEPNQLLIKRGDKVRFLMTDGGPHNVSFANQKIPAGARMVLENRGVLVGAMLQVPGQACEIEFTKDLPVGEYDFVCDPHNILGMKGRIVVTP